MVAGPVGAGQREDRGGGPADRPDRRHLGEPGAAAERKAGARRGHDRLRPERRRPAGPGRRTERRVECAGLRGGGRPVVPRAVQPHPGAYRQGPRHPSPRARRRGRRPGRAGGGSDRGNGDGGAGPAALRGQRGRLGDGPDADTGQRESHHGLAPEPDRRPDPRPGGADINRLVSTIDAVTIVGLALGVLAGLIGIALFTSGISGRVTAAAANAARLGAGQPIEPVSGGGDELGLLMDSLTRAEQLLISRNTELITARDAALTATQAKNAFLSSTSHELRTPLNAVLGFAQLLQMSDLSQEDREAVERILVAGHHLLSLINELIDIARIESGEFSLSVEPVAVQPVVEETCQLMAPLAADRSITISQDCPWPGLAVKADRQRLRQILVNLVSNAIKYNREGGSITLTCQATGPDKASLIVADTGPGIRAADLERIFDPFERLGAEQTAIEGTGIGLPLARAFAEAMCGDLTAASVPGEGTTFTVILPRTPDMAPIPQDHDRPSIPLPAPAGDDPAGTAIRVLYIEDNPANIEV